MNDQPHAQISVDWNTTSRAQWEKYVNGAAFAAYQQDYCYGEVIERSGGTVHRAVIRDGQDVIAIAQIQTRSILSFFTVGVCMLGPVWLIDNLSTQQKSTALDALRTTLPKGPRWMFLGMPADDDAAPYNNLKAPRIVSSYHTAFIDLRPDLKIIRAQLMGKWRNRLKAGEKAPLTIRRIGARPQAYAWLLEAEVAQRKSAGYDALPVELVQAYQETAGKKSVCGFEAWLNDIRVGGVLFLRHGHNATYHIGWSNAAGKAVSAHNRLLWEAIIALKRESTTKIDLGGMSTNKGDGLARFKLGMGAHLMSQAGIYLLRPRWR